MGIELQSLAHLKLPTKPDDAINLDGGQLQIAAPESVTKDEETTDLTAAIGVATVLYNWCPDALYAFLGLNSWFSFTWIRKNPDETKFEIGRIRNVITMGVLDKDEHWKVMLSYTISETGAWVPNTEESMLDDKDITDPEEIDRLGRDFVEDLILDKAWTTGKKIRHDFFIEYAPSDDAFSDGIAMNPHWLYQGINLSKCTTCGNGEVSLSRCSKCGTAAYCSGECQRGDWKVHKGTCGMSMEDRGKALHLSGKDGLINWRQLLAKGQQGKDEEVEAE